MIPAIFVSHGSPTLPLDPSPARDFLMELGRSLPRPRAVVAVSAHWETPLPTVNRVAANGTIHDFYGFPEALYRMRYDAPGSPILADRVRTLLETAGYKTAGDDARGLDHGAWVPLALMYPEIDIPVIQLGIQTPLGPEHHFKLGRALEALREDDVLVLGSGGFVHNLRALSRWSVDAPEPAWSEEFSAWVHARLMDGDHAKLFAYRAAAPFAAEAHPSEEHFMPLFAAAWGAGGEGARAERLHRSTTYGSLRMDAYAFS